MPPFPLKTAIRQQKNNGGWVLAFPTVYHQGVRPFDDTRYFVSYLSPELNMFIGTDWQQRCYENELTEIEPFVDDDEGICLGLLRQEDSWEKLYYKRAVAIEKYNL